MDYSDNNEKGNFSINYFSSDWVIFTSSSQNFSETTYYADLQEIQIVVCPLLQFDL